MNSKVVAVFVLFGCFLQLCFCVERDEIIQQYEPILAEKDANISAQYRMMDVEYEFVYQEIENNTISIVRAMYTQISSLKTTIANAKQTSVNSPNIITCLEVQEGIIANVSADTINATCFANQVFPDLSAARDDYAALSQVPNATIPSCNLLNPLPNQNGDFLECIERTIFSLDQQSDVIRKKFDVARNTTITTSVQCLATQSALIAQKLNEINFQVTLCTLLT